ncbi:MAG TPA: type II secretion system secretin GspD, partial [Steroidobacteraceae bacterium]|nr:type II secretion system secretin GspD [Steroidobacteraceae bacterium]
PASKLVADDRTNSVLISGEASQRLRLKTLVAHLDTPLVAGGDTQVRYLRYANAEKIAAKLKEQVTGIAQATPSSSSGSGAPGGAVPGAISASSLMGGGGSGTGEKGVIIWAEPQTNAIVVTAPPKIMRQVMSIVDRLDIRRAQVLVEAILVEMQVDKSIDLGVNWAVGKRDSQGNLLPAAGFISPVDGVGLGEVAAGIANPSSVTSLPTGLTMGVGRLAASGTSWTALIRAIGGTGNTNIIATPSILTLDNEEAEIKIAQEVPFVTGQYTTNSTTTTPTTGVVNPFTTVTRQEVGNILKITPQINEGDTVALKISQEASSIAASSQQVSKTDLITNKRTITTKVMVENGGIIVLGGLISDQVTESKTQVPFLGSIPVLGNLFKTTSVQKTKTNLMVFIRPRILRDGVDAAIETNAKYNYIRDQEHQVNDGKVPWMPSEHQPAAPPLEKLVPPNLLNPAHEAAPPGTTPAQRAEASSNAAAARETATDAAPAAPAIAPGAGAASPPPPPPPAPGH